MLTADRARWTAAAEGTVGVAEKDPLRLGLLSSTLFFRDRISLEVANVGRAGEELREILGELLAELEESPGNLVRFSDGVGAVLEVVLSRMASDLVGSDWSLSSNKSLSLDGSVVWPDPVRDRKGFPTSSHSSFAVAILYRSGDLHPTLPRMVDHTGAAHPSSLAGEGIGETRQAPQSIAMGDESMGRLGQAVRDNDNT